MSTEKRREDMLRLAAELQTELGILLTPGDGGAETQGFETLGKHVHFEASTHVLRQGEANGSLFIIIHGRVRVLVDGEQVAELKRKGDIIGEFSIITGSHCLADVVTVYPTQLLEIPADKIKALSPRAQLLIYKTMCLTMVSKLEYTNLKAKGFEILNRTLEAQVKDRTHELEERNHELGIGFRRLEELYRSTNALTSKLAHWREDLLEKPLLRLEHLEDETPAVAPAREALSRLNSSLRELIELQGADRKLDTHRVLVVEPNASFLNLLRMSLGSTGVEAEYYRSVPEGSKALGEKKFDVAFLSDESIDLVRFIRDHGLQTKTVLFTSEESGALVKRVREYATISNIIARRDDDRAYTMMSISSTIKKILTGDLFGLEKYLHWSVEVREFPVDDSAEREALTLKVLEHLKDLGVRSTIRSRCETVIEELLMNAIYDAPVDPTGKQIHNSKPRTERVVLAPEQKGRLRIATDGLYIAVSVEDPFGAFTKDTIIDYLENNYHTHDEAYNVHRGKGGAGKGLYLITENSDLVVYNVARGVRTEVIALFSLETKHEKSATSLHYFES